MCPACEMLNVKSRLAAPQRLAVVRSGLLGTGLSPSHRISQEAGGDSVTFPDIILPLSNSIFDMWE